VGADADIAIYAVNPEIADPSGKYKTVRKAFRRAAYTIKDGKIVVKNGEIVRHADGATMWLDVHVSEPVRLTDDMKKRFREYWTVEYENYPVGKECLKVSNPIAVKACV
jgi:formylmethanofuran dehydrogenase subunit A